MKTRIIIPLLLTTLLAGCATAKLRPGQCRIAETRVTGIDLSIPLPFAEGVNIANIRVGYIEHKSFEGNKVNFKSNSAHKDISLLTGSGSIDRLFEVSYSSDKK
jgi:hypothetical protein